MSQSVAICVSCYRHATDLNSEVEQLVHLAVRRYYFVDVGRYAYDSFATPSNRNRPLDTSMYLRQQLGSPICDSPKQIMVINHLEITPAFRNHPTDDLANRQFNHK